MPATRRSARLTSSQGSSPAKPESPRAATGAKRKSEAGTSPAPKRGKKDAPKQQKTLEETMDIDQPEESKEQPGPEDAEAHVDSPSSQVAKESSAPSRESEELKDEDKLVKQNGTHQSETKVESTDSVASTTLPGKDDSNEASVEHDKSANENELAKKSNDKLQNADQSASDAKQDGSVKTNGNAIEGHARDDETSSSILEKGIIYFFFRGRVGIDNPSDVQDIARSYIVLRPLPHGAKLGDGPIGPSDKKCRLLALPKKVLPTSGKDRFMTFVEKAHTSFPELKKSFLPADDYETKTAGTRHTPSVTPIAEGIYAITTTGRENHLAYSLSIPSSLGEVQKDMGLREQGSFVVSCKNPQYPGPSYASLPQAPEYPKDILDEFRSLRWSPLQPKHLDYENTQFLLIGESSGIDKALDAPDNDKATNEATPKEEIEKLEGEDEIRVKHLKGDDAIFVDLGVSKKDYPQVPTTWDE